MTQEVEMDLMEPAGQFEEPKVTEPEIAAYVPTTADFVREMLTIGGRAVVSVRSKQAGKHVTLVFSVRKKKPGGNGWVSRATVAGRVGILDGDCIEVRDPDLGYPENYVGRFYLGANASWRPGRDADRVRSWTAEKVISFALAGNGLDQQADVLIATQCSSCGRPLTHPESVERGRGPECYGRETHGRQAARS